MVSYRKLAYGKPKHIRSAGKIIDVGSTIGTKIVQIVYLRPPAFGYRIARGKK